MRRRKAAKSKSESESETRARVSGAAVLWGLSFGRPGSPALPRIPKDGMVGRDRWARRG